jgi:hypothetical protein
VSAGERAVELAAAVEAAGGALPLPVGPQMPDFPPPPVTEVEKLHAERARLQGLLAEAVADAHRARRERDEMRERVSEPYGCTHCGITKRGHGRRWTTGVGYHAWTAPPEGQVAERMKARRTVRLAARAGELGRLRAQVEALLVERHSTNEALDDVVQALRAKESSALPWAHAMDDGDLSGFLDDLVSAALNRWRHDPEVPDRETLADIEKVCADWRTPGQGLRSDEPEAPGPDAEADGITRRIAPTQALHEERAAGETDPGRRAAWRMLAEPEPEFHEFLYHPYTKGHDRPETGGDGRG